VAQIDRVWHTCCWLTHAQTKHSAMWWLWKVPCESDLVLPTRCSGVYLLRRRGGAASATPSTL